MATLTALALVGLFTSGCGDRCERLCREASVRLEACTQVDWTTYGARSRSDFVVKCRAEWERRSDDLTSSNLNEALEVCGEARDLLREMTCAEVDALYATDEPE